MHLPKLEDTDQSVKKLNGLFSIGHVEAMLRLAAGEEVGNRLREGLLSHDLHIQNDLILGLSTSLKLLDSNKGSGGNPGQSRSLSLGPQHPIFFIKHRSLWLSVWA